MDPMQCLEAAFAQITATRENVRACIVMLRDMRDACERIAENERLRAAFERNPGAPVDELYRAMEGKE